MEINDNKISLEVCRKHLEKYELSDEQLLHIRDSLYVIAEQVTAQYLKQFLNEEDI